MRRVQRRFFSINGPVSRVAALFVLASCGPSQLFAVDAAAVLKAADGMKLDWREDVNDLKFQRVEGVEARTQWPDHLLQPFGWREPTPTVHRSDRVEWSKKIGGNIVSSEQIRSIYRSWLAMWNGNLELAEQIVAPHCVVHQAPFGPGEPQSFRGPGGLVQMIRMGREPFDQLTFTCDVGPIVEGDQLAARWTGRGIYKGGLPGANAPAGTPITFSGIDIWLVEHGKIVAYWVSSDGAHLMAQLGMLPASP